MSLTVDTAFERRHLEPCHHDEVVVLDGPLGALRGVTIGVPTRLERDPASPLRVLSLGQWSYPGSVDTDASVIVVLTGSREDVIAVARAGLLYERVRLVYGDAP